MRSLLWAALFSLLGSLPIQAQEPESARADLATAQAKLEELEPRLEQRIADSKTEIAGLAERLAAAEEEDPELRARHDKLAATIKTLQARLEHLRVAARSYQEAVDAEEDERRSQQALTDLQRGVNEGTHAFTSADAKATEKELSQAQSELRQLRGFHTQAEQEREKLELMLQDQDLDPQLREVLTEDHDAWLAKRVSFGRKQRAQGTRIELLETRLQAATSWLERNPDADASLPTSSDGPSADERETELKKLKADHLSAQARDDLALAEEELSKLRILREQAEGTEAAQLTRDLNYWQGKQEQAEGKRQLASLSANIATEEEKLSQLEERIALAQTALDEAAKVRRPFWRDPGERPGELRQQAEEARQTASELHGRETEARERVALQLQSLDTLEAKAKANNEFFQGATSLEEFEHLRRMDELLEEERDQTRQLISEQKVFVYAVGEQSRGHQHLATLQERTADTLAPPLRQFLEEHRSEIRAAGLILAAFVATYVLTLLGKLLVWLVGFLVRLLRIKASVQRFRTLQGFGQSILKVLLWIWVLVAVLGEFGIDPAKSSGAIGLIGLILAGMFQQIVVDFVKGVDIVVGQHYHVGDFVQVDGKFGHVLDFNAKYTLIRTPSGQQISVPNSRCIPSRRFPDGYVDNYVDLRFPLSQQTSKARQILRGVCRELNARLEVLKEEPSYVEDFPTADRHGRVVRYRVRVLPGSDWVVKDYFIPAAKAALAASNLTLEGEPTTLFMNGVTRFRKLFSRELSEAEILEEAVPTPAPVAPPSPPPPESPPEDSGTGDSSA